MDVKETIQTELNKMKQMSPRDRIWYLLEYYKFHLAAVILAIVILSVIGSMIYRSTFTTRLSIAIVNDRSGGASSTDGLEQSLRQALGLGPKDIIEFNGGLSADFSDESAMSEYGYASLMKITALTASHDLDIMIADSTAIGHFEQLSAYMDLEEFLPSSLLEQVSPYLVYADDENGVSRAAALSLSGTRLPEQTGILIDSPCLAVLTNTTHTEEALKAIEYLFAPQS